MRYDISYVLEQSWLTQTLREKITTMGNTNIFAQYPLERSIYANIHTHTCIYVYIYLSYILKILYRCNLWLTHYSFKVLHMRASKITHTIRAFLVTVCTHTDSCVCRVCVGVCAHNMSIILSVWNVLCCKVQQQQQQLATHCRSVIVKTQSIWELLTVKE